MKQQYVVLPRSGLISRDGPAAEQLRQMSFPSGLESSASGGAEVLDAIQETGPKLVSMSEEAAAAMNRPGSPLRAAPVVTYPHPLRKPLLLKPLTATAAAVTVRVSCVDAQSAQPLPGSRVIAFTDFANSRGAEAYADAAGVAALVLPGNVEIERLYVITAFSHWGAFRANLPLADIAVPVEPVDLNFTDAVRHYYPAAQAGMRFDATSGVRVGVIDTGVGPHADVNCIGGHCTVTGQDSTSYGDVDLHGTHVAGLIGASGALTAVAPGATILSYRVFPDAVDGATNYAILKAMLLAALDGCDIVNLSLGGGPADPIVAEAIEDARNNGMLVVIAAGNDGRHAVSYPAAHPYATAVSALGRVGTFPAGSLAEADIDLLPPASDTDEFVAAFSNVGPAVAVTAPGVAVLSTLPNNGYGPLSGTSMAAPVVAGVAACLLSRDAVLRSMPRNRARSDAFERRLQQQCIRRGFGSSYEGYGLPLV